MCDACKGRIVLHPSHATCALHLPRFHLSSPEICKKYACSAGYKSINKRSSKIMFRATVSAAIVMNRVSNVWAGHK